MENVIAQIIDSDDSKAYKRTLEIVEESKESSKYYAYLKQFSNLLDNEKSYIRFIIKSIVNPMLILLILFLLLKDFSYFH